MAINDSPNLKVDFPNPFENYDKGYLKSLKKANVVNMHAVSGAVKQRIFDVIPDDDLDKIEVVTTGSDGRFEKSIDSPVELILLSRGNLKIIDDLKKDLLGQDYVSDVEVRNISSDSMAYPVNSELSNSDKPWPSLILDAYPIFGDVGFLGYAKDKLQLEVTKGEKAGSIYKDSRKKVADFRRITKTGKGKFQREEVEHFDVDAGIAWYNPEESQYAFKVGPNRLVQMKLVSELLRFVRSQESVPDDFLRSVPANIRDRLKYFEEQDLLSLTSDSLSELIDLYEIFTKLAHCSQFFYKEKARNELEFNAAEVRDALSSVLSLTDGGILKGTK